jgi:uncharacterized protein YjbI with pentapeptide repeats
VDRYVERLVTRDRVEEALERFELIAGWVGEPWNDTACAVSALSWIAEEPWSDRPECAHPLLCDIVVSGNDAPGTTPEEREALVRAGVTGLLDTADVPTEVVLTAVSGAGILPVLAGRGPVVARGYRATAVSALCVLEGVTAWKQGVRGFTGPLVLAGITLLDESFPNLDLGCADLRRAFIHRCDLSGADLRGADMREAKLNGSRLSWARMQDADLTGADMRYTTLVSTSLVGAHMQYTNLRYAVLYKTNLHHADLRHARFSENAPFTEVNLTSAVLSGVNLVAATFDDSRLFGADLRGADLSGADLSGCEAAGCDLRGASLTSANLNRTDLSGCDLRGADLCYADLRDATVDGADFTDAKLWKAQWTHPTPPPGWELHNGRLYPVDAEVAG